MQFPRYERIKNLETKKMSILVEIAFFVVAFIFILFSIFFGKDTLEFIKLKKTERDLEYFSEIVYEYKKLYRYLPGDDPFAEIRCPSSMYIENGNASGYIGDSDSINEEEQAIRHLRCAKILGSDVDEKYINYPRNSYGGIFKFSYINLNGEKFNIIKVYKIPLEVMKKIDKNLDDGDLKTGRILVIKERKNKKKEDVLIYILKVY
ncbi:MAG: hypothetical protein DSY59_00350 [Persephonella sp.]|nr:MAG: hypothetical protein DSY59_00350 [Persephonella sp.]